MIQLNHIFAIVTERLAQVIDTIVRYKESNSMEANPLKDELASNDFNHTASEVIERAKGILMRQRNLDAQQAYTLLNEMAVKRNIQIIDLSHQLIETAKMLTI